MNPIKLKDLPIDEQKSLLWSHHKKIPMEYWNTGRETWVPPMLHSLSPNVAYRLSPKKPSINWSHVGDKWNYMARDSFGGVYLYINRPVFKTGTAGYWYNSDDDDDGNCLFVSPVTYASYESGVVDWKDSLIQR